MQQGIDIQCRDWEAWHDRMPGKPATLRVTGTCTVPQLGYTCELEEDGEKPTSGTRLALRRRLTPPENAPWVMSECTCRFERETEASYSHVLIIPDNVTIDVKETSR